MNFSTHAFYAGHRQNEKVASDGNYSGTTMVGQNALDVHAYIWKKNDINEQVVVSCNILWIVCTAVRKHILRVTMGCIWQYLQTQLTNGYVNGFWWDN